MDGDRIAMSQRERDRLKVMAPVVTGRATQAEAARLLKRSTRQIRRIQQRPSATASLDEPTGRPEPPGDPQGRKRLHDSTEPTRYTNSFGQPTPASEAAG